jgi:hypothetical protein
MERDAFFSQADMRSFAAGTWQFAAILATRDEIAIGRALATSPASFTVAGYSSLILFS